MLLTPPALIRRVAPTGSMTHQLLDRIRLVMHREAIHQRGAGFVEATYLDLGPLTTELDHHGVQRADGGDVPEVRTADVDDDTLDGFLEVETSLELLAGGEEPDGWIIPADAKNVDNAYLFLNYMMRPEVAAGDTNLTWYANDNKDSFDLVDKEVTSSPAAYPSDEQVAKMYTLGVSPKKAERARTRAWTKFKSGE